MSEPPKVRLWCHEGQWRIQDYRQIEDRNGVLQDAWVSRRGRNKCVLMFETEEQARAHMSGKKKTND